ncbi:hypothetical protein [Photobacterium sp. DNB22_13_2]
MIKAVMEDLGILLSVSYGGVTFLNNETGATGFWSENGNGYVTQYSSLIHIEPIVYLQLTVLPEQADQALADIKKSIKVVYDKYNTG